MAVQGKVEFSVRPWKTCSRSTEVREMIEEHWTSLGAGQLKIQPPKFLGRRLQFQSQFPTPPASCPRQIKIPRRLSWSPDSLAQFLAERKTLRHNCQTAIRPDITVHPSAEWCLLILPLDGNRDARIYALRRVAAGSQFFAQFTGAMHKFLL